MMYRTIKLFIITASLVITGLWAKIDTTSNLYCQTMIVTALIDEDDAVILTDANGNNWSFEGIEDWHVGDVASVLMNNNGTVNIYDDEIVNVHCSGFSNNFEF